MTVSDRLPARYFCNCSRERVERALISLGTKEIRELTESGEDVEVNCHFCSRKYRFLVEDLKDMYKKARRQG